MVCFQKLNESYSFSHIYVIVEVGMAGQIVLWGWSESCEMILV